MGSDVLKVLFLVVRVKSAVFLVRGKIISEISGKKTKQFFRIKILNF